MVAKLVERRARNYAGKSAQGLVEQRQNIVLFGNSQDMPPIHTAFDLRLQFVPARFPIGQFTAREPELEFRAEASQAKASCGSDCRR